MVLHIQSAAYAVAVDAAKRQVVEVKRNRAIARKTKKEKRRQEERLHLVVEVDQMILA
jgi:hypothetical protein